MRVGINTEVWFTPPPARADTVFLVGPFAFAVNFKAGAVNQ
jgi:hypothetical protein